MNVFIECKSCELPVIVTSLDPMCPYCKKQIRNIQDGHNDGFGFYLEEYKNKTYFEWEDIQKLIWVCEYLTEINNQTCIELGNALIELHKTKDRLEWYRKQHTLKEIKK